MDVFRQLERPQNQQPQIPVQSGVDQTSYISQPDRFAVFDQIQPHRKPMNDFGGVDETPLVSMEKIRLLEIPSKPTRQPEEVEETVKAPTVLTPLQPIDAQEGSPVVLTKREKRSILKESLLLSHTCGTGKPSTTATKATGLPSRACVFFNG